MCVDLETRKHSTCISKHIQGTCKYLFDLGGGYVVIVQNIS